MKPQELTDADRAEQVAAILAAVTIESGPPRAEVDDTQDRKWPNVAFTVTLKRNGRAFFIGPYRFGVGHFAPTSAEAARMGSFYGRRLPGGADNLAAIWARKPGACFHDEALWAAVAADVALSRKFSPTVAQVLPSLLMDGAAYFDAETFDEWASNLGYDSDSIKARDTFDACDKIGRGVARAFTPAEIELLRDWGNER